MSLGFRCCVVASHLISSPGFAKESKRNWSAVFLWLIMAARALGDKMLVCKAKHRRRSMGALITKRSGGVQEAS